jgi:hypothetical protein
MSDRMTYSEDVPNYTGGELLHLEIGSRDGTVFVGLAPGSGGTQFKCALEVSTAEAVIEALQQAIKDLG